MPTRKPFKRIKPRLSEGDKKFIELVASGEKRSRAFRMAYPEHKTVKRYMDIVKDRNPEEKKKLGLRIKESAKAKLQSQYIQDALISYQNRMDELAALSLDVSQDLLENGKSEFVRADLAKEFIRHKVGTPVQRVQAQEEKQVIFSFGIPNIDNPEVKKRVEEDLAEVIEGEVV